MSFETYQRKKKDNDDALTVSVAMSNNTDDRNIL